MSFNLTQESFVKAVFIFFRVIGVLILCPIFGDRAFPTIAKVALGIFIALLFYPVIPVDKVNLNYGFYSIAILAVKETLVGVTIGLVILFMLIGVQIAGDVMGFQMGMWLADILDPQFGVETPVVSHFKYLFATMLFLAVNGHHIVLRGLKQSFVLLPLGGFVFSGNLSNEIVRLGSTMFRVGFQIGAPVIGILLLTSLAMALIARVIPELDILMIEIPLKIGIGLLFLALSLPYIANVLLNIYRGLGNNILGMLKLMAQ